MKFYDCSTAPSPRRVRIFIAEKGLDIPTVNIDLRGGEQLKDEFKAINPQCTVPVLVLDSGTALRDSNSICQYLEEMNPEPNLMGRDAEERAVVASWHRHVEWDGFTAVGEALRNSAPGLAGRALTGPVDYDQIPALAERGRARLREFVRGMNGRLGETSYVAGDRYTIADITCLVTVEFMGWLKEEIPDWASNLKRWYAEASVRPGSVK